MNTYTFRGYHATPHTPIRGGGLSGLPTEHVLVVTYFDGGAAPEPLTVGTCWTGSQLPELRALRIRQSSLSLFRQHDVRVKIGLQGFAIFEQRMQVHLYLRRAQAP